MKYGEIWQLGEHKLMCGDATKIDDINALIDDEKIDLILTDPPYGMKCQDKDGAIGDVSRATPRANLRILDKNGRRRISQRDKEYILSAKSYPVLQGDKSSDTTKKFYENIKDYDATKIIWGGQYFADFLPINGGWLFWDKLNGDSDFSDGELAWVSRGKRVRKYEHMWCGCIRGGTPKLNGYTRVHPTQKPVELHARILEDFSKPGDVVLDCFGGSGTTLIACEITGRKCLMMEISPEYCEIIKSRYEELSPLFNRDNTRLLAASE